MKKRRPKGEVKALVIAAHDQKMSAPELAKISGISAWTIYNCAARLGLRLRRIKR
jgi:transposase